MMSLERVWLSEYTYHTWKHSLYHVFQLQTSHTYTKRCVFFFSVVLKKETSWYESTHVKCHMFLISLTVQRGYDKTWTLIEATIIYTFRIQVLWFWFAMLFRHLVCMCKFSLPGFTGYHIWYTILSKLQPKGLTNIYNLDIVQMTRSKCIL